MIELIINGQHLPVRQKPLSFRFKNPILHKADGSLIYNLEIPINPTSRQVFGFMDRLESRGFGQLPNVVGELRINDVGLGNVVLEVNKTTATDYQCSAGVQRGLLNYVASEVKLADLLRDVVVELPTTEAELLALFWASGTSMADQLPFVMFPVKNTLAFKEGKGWPIPELTREALIFQNPLRLISGSEIIPFFPHTPFFKLHFVLKHIAEKLGFELLANDFESNFELSRLVVYSNNCVFAFDRYYGNYTPEFRLADFLPDMTVQEFLEAIELPFNAKLIPHSIRKSARMLLNDAIFDPQGSIDLQVPESQVSEVDYQKLINTFAFKFRQPNDEFYSQYVVELDKQMHTLRGVVADESMLPSPASASWGDVWQSAATGAYYALSITDSDVLEWAFMSLDLIEHVVGNGERRESFESLATPAITVSSDYYHAQQVECPHIEVPAFGNIYRGTAEDAGLRLIFYRGIGLSFPDNYPYPFASSDSRRISGAPIPGAQYAIRWQGPGGFLDKFWPKRLNWMKKGVVPVTCQKQLTLRELSEWDWTAAYKVGSRNTLSSIIEGEIMPNGVLRCRMELLPL